MTSNLDALIGCLLGQAVGDALGLPLEGLKPQRARKLFGPIDENFGMRLWFRRGFVSDDTEHAVITLQAFVSSQGEAHRFERDLTRGLKLWFLRLPPGTGLATAKSCLKLLLGFPVAHCGVFSAGNGPAMRAPILGVICKDEIQLCELVKISSKITHSDPKATIGALIIAFAARFAVHSDTVSAREFYAELNRFFKIENISLEDEPNLALLNQVVESVEAGQKTTEFAQHAGMQNGVSGYIYHTVPIVLHAWLSNPRDVRQAIVQCLSCGGDADSTGAIAGALSGAAAGKNSIPIDWLNQLAEWPRDISWMKNLARQSQVMKPAIFEIKDLLIPLRNIFLLVIVLLHGFRRLLPPY